MIIERIAVVSFGPLSGESLDLGPGMNVIFGENEAAKSTLHAALYAGLCGMRRSRGSPRSEDRDFDARHRPWDGEAWRVQLVIRLADGRRIELDQDLANLGRCHARDLTNGRDVTNEIVFEGSPDASRWLGLTRRSFLSTACVRQAELMAVAADPAALQEELQRAAATAGRDETAAAAIARLKHFHSERVGLDRANSTKPLRRAREGAKHREQELAVARSEHARVLLLLEQADELDRASQEAELTVRATEVALTERRVREAEQTLERISELAERHTTEPSPLSLDQERADRVAGALALWEGSPAEPDLSGPSAEELRQAILALRDPPNSDFLPVYSATGLRSDSCERLRTHVVDNADVVAQLLHADDTDFQALADLMLDACASLDEMQPEAPFDGDRRELLAAWISGSTVGAIRGALGDEAPPVEALTKFIEDFFAYRLPWGFASYLRIAEQALDMEREAVGPGPRFFPSMVKFGVPFPEAAWAMAAGVPVRRVAIALGEAFLVDQASRTFADFFEWIGRVDTEALHRVYGLAGPVLDDVARALRRAGRNPLLADGRSIEELLPLGADIRGIAFDNRRAVARRAKVGDRVALARDYANVVDDNAVLVHLGAQQLGHLPRQVAQLLAPEMDAGRELVATVAEIEDDDGLPSVGVVIAPT